LAAQLRPSGVVGQSNLVSDTDHAGIRNSTTVHGHVTRSKCGGSVYHHERRGTNRVAQRQQAVHRPHGERVALNPKLDQTAGRLKRSTSVHAEIGRGHKDIGRIGHLLDIQLADAGSSRGIKCDDANGTCLDATQIGWEARRRRLTLVPISAVRPQTRVGAEPLIPIPELCLRWRPTKQRQQ